MNCLNLIPIVLAPSGCFGGQTPGDADLLNVPGEDSSLAVLLGQGLNPIENRAKGHCVTLGALETQSGNVTGDVAEFRLLVITSEAQLRESLNVSASASFSILTNTSIGGRVSFAQSVGKNNQSRYLIVHTRVA